jgi:hypothetical protein
MHLHHSVICGTHLHLAIYLSYILECVEAGSSQPLRPRHYVGTSEGMHSSCVGRLSMFERAYKKFLGAYVLSVSFSDGGILA